MLDRRAALLLGLSAAVTGWTFSYDRAYGDNAFPVVGRTVQWRSTLRGYGWIGGNLDQITSQLARYQQSSHDNDSQLVGLVKFLMKRAAQVDVCFFNGADFIDAQSKRKSNPAYVAIPTYLEADLIEEVDNTDFSDANLRSEIAKAFAESVKKEGFAHPSAATTQIAFVKQTSTGGKPALSIGIKGSLPDNSTFYEVRHWVALGDRKSHAFDLTVAADHYVERLNDFNQMLQAVRYL
jgi:hypothetical protein